ncbi:hypothetical protein SNE40_006914 [Patella caerulea]|uniref:Uncharacterized protein n=1 Tax=Patella caerulea TaxID=87958 RepID=A0AAN8K4U1_PATCE
MVVKRKDFQKAAAFIHEFLLKLTEDLECAEVRDSLKLALLHMQKYYRVLQSRNSERNTHTLQLTARGLSPMTPFVDTPDKFQWKWLNMDAYARMSTNMSIADSINLASLPEIIEATLNDDIDMIEELIRRDPSCLDDRDGIGRTALTYAVHFFKHEPLQYILNNQADPNSTAHDGSTALHLACHDGNSHAVRLLLEAGSDVAIVDAYGRSSVHWAVTTPETDCLQILLDYNADTSLRDKDGLTPNMWACQLDHIKHFELLSRSEYSHIEEADGIERDVNGRTWMHWAVRRTEPLECLQTLLTADSARIKDHEGKTVILLAAEMGSLPSCQVILEIAGTECLQDVDNGGRSALHLAALGGHGDVVNYLLEHGADYTVTDKHEATAWDYARNRQLHYCQLIFMSHQRQRIKSNPTSPLPNGHGMFNGNFNYDDYDGNSTNRSKPTTPITPPHPPKRPRTSRTLNRRSNSMGSPEKESSFDWTSGRTVVSANNNQKRRIEVSVTTPHVAVGAFEGRDETAMVTDEEDGGPIEFVEEDVDGVSAGGMDVSDIEDNDDIQRTIKDVRPPPSRRGPHERSPQRQPHPPQRKRNPLSSGGYSPQRSQDLNSNSQEKIQLTEEEHVININHPVPKPPPSAVYRSGRTGPVPSPPNSTPQRPHMLRQPQPLPRTIPTEQQNQRPTSSKDMQLPPAARPNSGGSTYREQVTSPPLAAAIDQVKSNQPTPPSDTVNRPTSGQKPPGVLEGRRIPPPMLTPLSNAPKLPTTDSFDKILKKKNRKKRKDKDKESESTSPQNPLDIPPPRGFAAPLHPPQQNRVSSAVPPPPRYSKGTPSQNQSRYTDENIPEEKVTNGDLPNHSNTFQAMDSEEHSPHNGDMGENESIGPLIPPPQGFRNTGQGRPLSQSIPQDSRIVRMPPTSAKPPLPRTRNSASVQRPSGKSATPRRPRPPTSRSTNA